MKQKLKSYFNPPEIHYGAEWNDTDMRIVSIRLISGKVEVVDSFSGPLENAAEYAVNHGISFHGLTMAMYDIPFKCQMYSGNISQDEDALAREEERLVPAGIKSQDMLKEVAYDSGTPVLLQTKQDFIDQYFQEIPEGLDSVWALTPGPVSLALALDREQCPSTFALIVSEPRHTSILFVLESIIHSCHRIPYGSAYATEAPDKYAVEIKKALVYHWETRVLAPPLEAVYFANTKPDSPEISALEGLPIEQPVWKSGLEQIEPELRPAASAALSHANGTSVEWSLGDYQTSRPLERKLWFDKSKKAVVYGGITTAVMAMLVVLLALTAFSLKILNRDDAVTFRNELKDIREMETARQSAEKEMIQMKSIMGLRSHVSMEMQKINASLPPDLWLQSWRVEPASNGHSHILEGYSLKESGVSDFLSQLEQARAFEAVKLKSTEKIPPEVVAEKTEIKANHKPLVQFQIQLKQGSKQ